LKKQRKPQYAEKDDSHLVRLQILIPREDYKKIKNWVKLTGGWMGMIDLIRPAISEKLLKEEKRLEVKL